MSTQPALCVYPGAEPALRLKDVQIEELAPGTVRIAGGVRTTCATELAVAAGNYYRALPGRTDPFLVAGHEAGGKVVEVSRDLEGKIKPGMLCTIRVRYPNSECCDFWGSHNRVDLSEFQSYRELGMIGMDGVHRNEFVVPGDGAIPLPNGYPAELATLPDLVSCIRKGIREAYGFRNVKLDGLQAPPKRAIVLGAGPAGLVATKIFTDAGIQVLVVDLFPDDAAKVRLAKGAETKLVHYVRNTAGLDPKATEKLLQTIINDYGRADFLFEGTGRRDLGELWTGTLGAIGIVIWFGIPHGNQNFPGDNFVPHSLRKMTLNLGETNCINAAPQDWTWAIEHINGYRDFYGKFLSPVLDWGDITGLQDALRDPQTIKPRILLPGERA